MESVIKYLPSPLEKGVIEGRLLDDEGTRIARGPDMKRLCALAFKVVNDRERGLVSFFRVYSGKLKNRMKVKNVARGTVERVQQLYRMRADDPALLQEIGPGDIGAIVGCKEIRSGDTLIDEADQEKVLLEGVKMPPPVFFCSIEPLATRDKE